MFIQNLKDRSDFYYELGGNTIIDYDKLNKLGSTIYQREKYLRVQLTRLSKINKFNGRLVALMANFRLNFEERPPESITKYIEWSRTISG